jgi:RND family efflux transporter MFP subunit
MSLRSAFPLAIKVLLALAVLGAAGYFAWARSHPVVRVEAVRKGKAVDAVTGSVTVSAEFVTPIRAAVGGLIKEAKIDTGLTVKKGDFLVQIDPTDLELEIEATEDNLRTVKRRVEVGSVAKIELENAKVDLGNAERAAAMGTYSSMDLDRVRRNVRAIEQRLALEEVNNDASISSLENTLAVRRRQLEKMTVRSPDDGVVSEVFARAGHLIGGEAPIATLISASRIVEAKISEESFAGVRVGQRASLRFLGYGDERFDGKVSKVLPTADPATQRYVVHLDVAIALERLVPGLTGEVAIVVGERPDALIFPRRALFGGKVYVVRDGRVEIRPVKTGFMSLNEVEVVDGLKEGETVLVEGLDLVRPGERVRLPERD